jgi:diguanylate cyclase (GGDEF)-like protein
MDRSTAVLQNSKAKVNPILLMLDLDHFKMINDTWGHPVGDKVLKLMGDVTKVALRRDDIAGRYGGEEFCILLCDCSREDSQRFDTRIREQLRDWSKSEMGFEVTFSAGSVVCTPGLTLAEAIKQADEALYRAKAQGRNQTVVAA